MARPASTERGPGTSADVLLGLGGCVDYEIAWDARVVEDLVAEHAITVTEIGPPAQVTGERDILRELLGQLRAGGGGERFVADQRELLSFAHRFRCRVSLGGSSVRAAAALDRFGIASTVHLVSTNDDVRRLLPPSASHLSSAVEDSTDPHVVVQYPSGARVRAAGIDVVAPRANRLILVNDPPNQQLLLADGFSEAVAAARVVVVSGLNTMTGPDALREKTIEVRGHLRVRTEGCVVVYEDAGFHHDEHRRVVIEELSGDVDVWSMNEDEAQHYLGRSLDLLDPEAVAVAVRELREIVGAGTIVVHTRYWALAHGEIDLRDGLRLGVDAATARYAEGDGWHAPGPRAPGAVEDALTAFASSAEARLGRRDAVVPIPRLAVAEPTTIGLGDTFLGGLVAGLVGVGASTGTPR